MSSLDLIALDLSKMTGDITDVGFALIIVPDLLPKSSRLLKVN